ncbi:MAG: hypothetical protein KDA28_07965, partial [Phycisphaerales bacterium]|nr:hypothetical protein [Phycisphaerales bacterium]
MASVDASTSDPIRGSLIWPIVTGASGALLLLQTAVAVASDAISGDATVWQGVALSASFLALAGALFTRWPTLLLFLFPTSLLPLALLSTPTSLDALFATER